MRHNVAGGSRDRGLYGLRHVYGAGMRLEVGETVNKEEQYTFGIICYQEYNV